MRRRRTAKQWAAIIARAAVRVFATVLLVVAFLSVGLRIYLDRSWTPEVTPNQLVDDASAMERLRADRRLARLEAALEVYRLEQGGYPDTLDALVEAGLVSASALRIPHCVHPVHYARAADAYVLLPPRY